MIAVLQRVNSAVVYADGIKTADTGYGLYILLGVEKDDTEKDADLLAEKISKLRIFSDADGKLNLSVKDIDGEISVVSNFTLNANYAHGNRPDYFSGAAPREAERLYEYFVSIMKSKVRKCESGVFGADMRTEMSTDGPVTIVMNSKVLYTKKN
ncbi:MAG: D-tyrosyl-tRNA(Tyr) deacylase [Ruminococcaceae bacterium]|nr:D-tyrosyl-tRNA(Tyr) deacylase [Oscillospiraceae bacterium]